VNRTDLDDIDRGMTAHLKTLREALQPEDDTPADEALCTLETFVALSLRVMRKTNPSKIRSEARTLEIKARMDGKPVLRGAA
jgi:hypothetical protein